MSRRARTWGWLRHSLAPRLIRGVVAAAVFTLPATLLAVLVSRHWHVITDLDQRLVIDATDVTRRHPGFKDALIGWQTAFHPQLVYLAAIPFAIWAWVKGFHARTIWAVVTMLVGWNLGLQAKLIVERARPLITDPVSHAPGYSFPSGHAFNTAMMLTTLLILLWPLLRYRVIKGVAVAVAAVLIILTALDRVFLGVHFPSDVTAGVLLAVGLSFASYLGFAHTPHRREAP